MASEPGEKPSERRNRLVSETAPVVDGGTTLGGR